MVIQHYLMELKHQLELLNGAFIPGVVQTADSLEKPLMLGKIEGRRRKGCQDEMAGWHH